MWLGTPSIKQNCVFRTEVVHNLYETIHCTIQTENVFHFKRNYRLRLQHSVWFVWRYTILPGNVIQTRVKLTVTSRSRHFRERQRLGKNTTNKKTSRYAKKNSKKTYYGKIVLQTTQTYYFKRLLSNSKPFSKFFRISNALKQQRFSHQVKASAKIFKRTSLPNIISYPIKPFSSSTLFTKVTKIIHKHYRLLRYAALFSKFFGICWFKVMFL